MYRQSLGAYVLRPATGVEAEHMTVDQVIVRHVRNTCLAGLRKKFRDRRQMTVRLRLERTILQCVAAVEKSS